MKSFLTSTLLCGMMAIFASWALVGCRFGNKTETAKTTTDTISGYYETSPKEFWVGAIANNVETDVQPGLTNIPAWVSGLLTNPSILYLRDPSKNLITLLSLDQQNRLSDMPLEGSSFEDKATGQAIFFNNEKCLINRIRELQGSFSQYAEGKTLESGKVSKGRLKISFSEIDVLDGDCAQSLVDALHCYKDLSQCPGELNEDKVNAFNLASDRLKFYFDSGAVAEETLSSLQTRGWQANFE